MGDPAKDAHPLTQEHAGATGRRGPAAVLVTVGDELLLGQTVDTNAAWLGRELGELGLPVSRRYTVGDVDDDIRDAVSRALGEGDVVLVTGGLGPTSDDRTRDVVAELLDAPLELHEDLLDALRAYFLKRGYDALPERNVSQAMVPRGARVLPNDRGSAPGLALRGPGGAGWVVLLPGVPREMRGIFTGSVAPLIRESFGAGLRPLAHRRIHTTGIAESELAGQVDEALPSDMGPVSVAFLPDLQGVTIRLTARDAGSADQAESWLDRIEASLAPVVDAHRFDAAESGDLVEAVSEALLERGLLVATAESCTGGLIAKRLTDRPGSSRIFAGGIVAYANEAKVDLLGVDPEVLARVGAVSEEVARQMATGAARRLGVGCGIGITGVAGPGGGTDEKPVGLVWYAVSVDGGVTAEHRVFGRDREDVRERSAQAALALLYRRLRGAGGAGDAGDGDATGDPASGSGAP